MNGDWFGDGDIERWKSDVASLGCCICGSPACLHHLKTSRKARSQREDDWHVIPLCPACHQHGGWGIAYHAGPREWEWRHGTQLSHLERTIEKVRRKRDIERIPGLP